MSKWKDRVIRKCQATKLNHNEKKTLSRWGRGKNYVFCTLFMPCLACVTFCGFHHKLNSPTVCSDYLTDFQYCFFFYICMHFSPSQIQPTPSFPFSRKGSVLVCGALNLTTRWLGEWTGTPLLSEPNSSGETSPNPVYSGCGWPILELDPEGPAFQINIIIHHDFAMCSAKHRIGNKQQILKTPQPDMQSEHHGSF